MIGCLTAAGVLVLLSGLAIGGFLLFMKWLRTVPPESTQIVLYNDTNEPLRIDRIDYGPERVVIDADPVLAVRDPQKYTRFRANIWRDQPEMSRTLTVWYTALSTGEQWRVMELLSAFQIAPANLSRSCEGAAAKFHHADTTNCRISRTIRQYTWR